MSETSSPAHSRLKKLAVAVAVLAAAWLLCFCSAKTPCKRYLRDLFITVIYTI